MKTKSRKKFIETSIIPTILDTFLASPAAVLSIDAPDTLEQLQHPKISRFVYPGDKKPSDNPAIFNCEFFKEITESAEEFPLILGGFIDSGIGLFYREKSYPFDLKIADRNPDNALEILKERQAKFRLFENISSKGYVVCQLHPDAFSCDMTRNNIANLGLFIHGACQIGTWKSTFCLTLLSKRKPKKIYSLLVHKDDEPRIKAFLEFVAGKCADKPIGMVESLSDKFLSPVVAATALKYHQEAKRLGLKLIEPSLDDDAVLPLKVLMEAFHDTEPSDDDLLDEPEAISNDTTSQNAKPEKDELLYSYLKRWFFSDLGEIYASILRRKGESSSVWPIELLPPVPIPDPAICTRLLNLDSNIASLEGRTKQLENDLWKSPKKISEHEKRFKEINIPKDDPGWISEMPFPLASILWQVRNAQSEKERMELLLKFFEGLASFHAMILMSAADRSPAIKVELRSILMELDTRGQSLTRATFGTWSNTFGRLAKVIRAGVSVSAEKARQSGFLHALGIDNIKVIQSLISKDLGEIFKETNNLRNRITGHGPLITESLAAIHVADLIPLLDRWRANSAGVWEHVRLIQTTGQSSKRAGLHHVTVKLLMGNQQPFPVETVALVDTPDSDFVHLHCKDSENSLQLIPFIRICDPPAGTQSACYFYNRSDAQGAHYVTYYANQSPEEVFQEDPASMIMRLLA